jgi:hypothetical protein
VGTRKTDIFHPKLFAWRYFTLLNFRHFINMQVARPRRIVISAYRRPETYREIKKTLRRDTLRCGLGLTAFYTGVSGVSGGVSSVVGTIASVAYVGMLGDYVDRIEESPIQKQLLIPISTAVFETVANGWDSFPIDFNYAETFTCFMSYKMALLFMAYKEICLPDE